MPDSGLEPIRLALLVVHLIGLASVIAPWLLQRTQRSHPQLRIIAAGGLVQFATAVGLVIVRRASEDDITDGMVAIKLVVSGLIAAWTVVAYILQRAAVRRREVDASFRPWLDAASAAAVANGLISIVWA